MEGGLVIAGKYHVVQLIAQGGMGAVYDAINVKTGRRVALKLIKERGLARGPAALRRFEREAKAAGAIESLHVVQVLDAGEDDASGMPFMVMEFLQGEDLRAVLARGRLPAQQAVAIAMQVCLGLVRAHEADIIHRDLKPANLFITEADADRRLVKLLDFGIAKLLHDETHTIDLTTTGDMVGSPPYMSPEQLVSPRDVDHRSDLWSLGVVLYEMLSGEVPTAGVNPIGARVYAICHAPAPSLAERVPGIRPELAAIVHRALALDPNARFASAQEMLDALLALYPEGVELRGRDLGSPPRAESGVVTEQARMALTVTEVDPASTRRASRARLWAAAGIVASTSLAIYLGVMGITRAGATRADEAPVAVPVPVPVPVPALGNEPVITNANVAPTAAPASSLAASSSSSSSSSASAATSVSPGSVSSPSPASKGASPVPRSPTNGARKLAGHMRAKAGDSDAGAPRSASTPPATRSGTTGREAL